MKIIYDEQGNFADLSDEEKQVKEIENNIDFQLFIKKLPEKDRKIAEMISEGYTYREIAKELKTGFHRIQNIGNKLDKISVE